MGKDFFISNKSTLIHFVLLLVWFISVLFAMQDLYNTGILIDEAIFPADSLILKSPWISLALSLFAFVLLLISRVTKRKYWLKVLSGLLVLASLSVHFLIVNKVDLRELNASLPVKDKMAIIGLEDFKSLQNGLVYIGRGSCPVCEQVYPELASSIEEFNLDVLYYNTEQDRNHRYQEMLNVLNQYEVASVPTLIHIVNGQTVEIYCGEDIVTGIKHF